MTFNNRLHQLLLFFSFLLSVVFYSTPFYFLLYSLTIGFILLSLFTSNVFTSLVGTLVVVCFFVHGWKGVSHVLEDYTFNALLNPIFVSLANLILFRLLLNLWF
jgi:succinate dehydrogenase hydrophobic anchor subunit